MLQVQEEGALCSGIVEPQKVYPDVNSLIICIFSQALVANAFHFCIVDSVAMEHVMRDRGWFIGYHQILIGTQYLFIRKGTREDVIGIGCYQLKLLPLFTFILHGVIYVCVQHNLLTVVAMLSLGFTFSLSGNS